MEKSKVYFTNLRTTFDCNLLQKLKKLITAAGIGKIDFTNKYAAIKIHFGEPGNLAFLRPNYAKVVADTVKELGGKPFLTDCNTLYVGGRKNALDHLDAAYENGFSPFSTGCHVHHRRRPEGHRRNVWCPLRADYVKEAKIGTAIMDADVFISLTHFKGHEATGFGGLSEEHRHGLRLPGGQDGDAQLPASPTWPRRSAWAAAPAKRTAPTAPSPSQTGRPPSTTPSAWAAAGASGAVPWTRCRLPATRPTTSSTARLPSTPGPSSTDKPSFHISLVVDVSPYCDCHSENDLPIVPDVGMFASFDPIALDQACADAVNAQPSVPGSILDERGALPPRPLHRHPSGHQLGKLPGARRQAGPGHPGVRAYHHPIKTLHSKKDPAACQVLFLLRNWIYFSDFSLPRARRASWSARSFHWLPEWPFTFTKESCKRSMACLHRAA